MKIVVIGDTGMIGSKTIPILRQHAHEVVAASPDTDVNTITGEGLKEAMAGTPVVIDLTKRSRAPPLIAGSARYGTHAGQPLGLCRSLHEAGRDSEWTCRQRGSNHESRSTP